MALEQLYKETQATFWLRMGARTTAAKFAEEITLPVLTDETELTEDTVEIKP